MKTLIFILLALFIFTTSYTQEVENLPEEELGGSTEEIVEEVPENEVGSTEVPEEENVVEEEENLVEEEVIQGEEVQAEELETGEVPEEESASQEVEDNWNNVDLTEFDNDPFGQKVLYFGVQWIVSQLIGYDVIPNDTNWNATTINWVDTQPAADGINYRINALFTGGQRDSFTGEIIINADSTVNRTVVISTAYTLGTEEENATNLENAEVIITELEVENIVEAPVLVEAEAATQGETEVTVVGDWEDIDLTVVLNDPNLQNVLTQSADFAIAKGQSEGTLPPVPWSVAYVPSISRQVAERTNYRFSMVFNSNFGDPLEAKGQAFAYQESSGVITVVTSGFWAIAPAPEEPSA